MFFILYVLSDIFIFITILNLISLEIAADGGIGIKSSSVIGIIIVIIFVISCHIGGWIPQLCHISVVVLFYTAAPLQEFSISTTVRTSGQENLICASTKKQNKI
ncbi:hypothetical protein ACJX0J_024047 [Zea mays]